MFKKSRGFLILALLLMLVTIMLSGCGSKEDKQSQAKSEGESKTLNVMAWGSYIDWAVPLFKEKYGVNINIDYYASEQEAMNKLKAGRLGSVDIVFLGSGWEEQAYQNKLIQTIDTSKLTNFNQLYPFFQKATGEPAIRVPFAWGSNGFMYNADKIPGELTSWKQLWNPAYKGKVAMVDRPELVYWLTAIAVGRDMNDGSDAAFTDIRKAAGDMIKLNKAFWSTGDDVVQYMKNDEVWIAYGAYDGLARQLQSAGKNVKYVIPNEGAQGWVDNLCLVSDAPNKENAMKFIDFMISAEAQTKFAKDIQYGIVNSTAGNALPAELKTQLSLDKTDEVLPKLKLNKFMGMDWITKNQEMWTELKGSGGN